MAPPPTASTRDREEYYATINASGDYVELKLAKGGYGADLNTLMGFSKTKPAEDKVRVASSRGAMLENGFGVPIVVVYKNAKGRQCNAKVVCPINKIEELFNNGASKNYKGLKIVKIKPVTRIIVSV